MRSRNTPVIAVACTALALLAGCSEKPAEESATEVRDAPAARAEAADAAVDAAVSASEAAIPETAVRTGEAPPTTRMQSIPATDDENAPGVTSGAAAGVAFTYNYAFTLPGKAISGVQQQHAIACERLGPQRCKITGMSYQQPSKDSVSARLDLMLAPELAQRFGADAVAAVERADGTLETANVEGQNAGGAIEDSQRRSGTVTASLDRIQKRLAVKDLGADERQQLVQRADELRSQLGDERQLRGAKEAALALTPMSFAYGSEGLFAANGNPFGTAAKASMGSLGTMLATVLTVVGIALPWLLLAGVLLLAFRFYRLKRQFAAIDQETAAPTAAQ